MERLTKRNIGNPFGPCLKPRDKISSVQSKIALLYLFIFIGIIVQHASTKIVCSNSIDEIKCAFMDEKQTSCLAVGPLKPECNQTTTCEVGHGCYSLWKNSSGVIDFRKKGCWPSKTCPARKDNQKECVGHYNSHSVLYFCCCLGSMCNTNISNVTTLREEIKGGMFT